MQKIKTELEYFSTTLTAKGPNKSFWRHLDWRDDNAREILLGEMDLNEDVVDALLDHQTRPRYFTDEDGVVFILRAINGDEDSKEHEMVSIRVWVDKHKIITLASYKIEAICTVFNNINKGGSTPIKPIDCLMKIVEAMVDDIVEVVEDINYHADLLETEVIRASTEGNLRTMIGDLRRKIVAIRRYLAPLRDIYPHIKSDKVALLSKQNREEMREIYNKVTKSIEDLDYARDHMAVSFEEMQSKTTFRISKIMYVISIVTIIFMPMGLLTSLLGINVRGIPFAEDPHAFLWVVCFLGAICSCLLFFLKKLKWI